jgi:hypothetical protein
MAMTSLAQAVLQGMMLRQQPAPPMLADQGQVAPNWQSLLQPPNSRPSGAFPEINPGMTWGGKDKNAIQPNDVMSSRFYRLPIEGL